MSFLPALSWTLGVGALLLYLILRLLFSAFKGAKEVDNAGTSVDEGKRTTGNEARSKEILKETAQPEGTFSTRMDIPSGELFYPGGLIDRKLPDNVPRSSERGPPSQPIAQVGRETVHIRLRGTRRRILSSDSSAEEEEKDRCPRGGCSSQVNSLVSSRVVPLSNVTSERTLTTIEKREERMADVRLSVLSKKTELGSGREVLAPLSEATGCDRAPEAEPLAASSGKLAWKARRGALTDIPGRFHQPSGNSSSLVDFATTTASRMLSAEGLHIGRPLKSHRDQVVEQVRKCRSIVQALTATSAGSLSRAQRMFSSRKLRAASAPWANRASESDENSSDEPRRPGAYDDNPQPVTVVAQRPQSLLAGFRRVGRSSANEDGEMSMAMASPENCQKLSRCLTSETQTNERGVAMFMRQRQRADKYTIDEETPRRTPLPRSFAPTPTRPTAFQPAKIRPDELLESVRAAASRREQTMGKPVPRSRRSTSVEPDRHRWTGIVSPFDYAIGAQTPSSYELPTTKAKGVHFVNGPANNNATEPLYIQCYDRPSVDYNRPSAAAPQTVGPNFNSLPRGWKGYKANLKAPSLR